MQYMVLSLSTRVRGGLSVQNLSQNNIKLPNFMIIRTVNDHISIPIIIIIITKLEVSQFLRSVRICDVSLVGMLCYSCDYMTEIFISYFKIVAYSLVRTRRFFWSTTRVGTLIVAAIYLQLIQNRYMFRSFTVLQCSHQHCVQPVASDVEVVGHLQQRLLC